MARCIVRDRAEDGVDAALHAMELEHCSVAHEPGTVPGGLRDQLEVDLRRGTRHVGPERDREAALANVVVRDRAERRRHVDLYGDHAAGLHHGHRAGDVPQHAKRGVEAAREHRHLRAQRLRRRVRHRDRSIRLREVVHAEQRVAASTHRHDSGDPLHTRIIRLLETRGRTTFPALLEAGDALRRRAVRERLGLDVALRALLERVVADLRRGVERLVDVAEVEDLAAVRVLRPRAGEAIGLQLDLRPIRCRDRTGPSASARGDRPRARSRTPARTRRARRACS